MTENHESFTQNYLLAALTKDDLQLLAPSLEWVDLFQGKILSEAGQKLDYAYFPTSGICSIIAQNHEGIQIETGIVGREGFVGIAIVHFAVSTPSQVIVQAEGRALRISSADLLNAIGKSQTLLARLLQYAHTFNVQVAQTALANGYFTINQRLARWLLMCQDRSYAQDFPMTHRFLAVMLAVRRAGITDSLSYLEGRKAIRALRGRIIILNRGILEELAGSAYGVPENEYKRIIKTTPAS
jgi:CRP-like cAMP-binding protein